MIMVPGGAGNGDSNDDINNYTLWVIFNYVSFYSIIFHMNQIYDNI